VAVVSATYKILYTRSILAAVLLHFMYNFSLGLVSPLSERIFLFQVVFLFIAAAGVIFVTDWINRKNKEQS